MSLKVIVLSPKDVLYSGEAKSVIMPGEEGVFEVAGFHKRMLSRLLGGVVFVDSVSIRIQRGIAKIDQDKVTVIVEEA